MATKNGNSKKKYKVGITIDLKSDGTFSFFNNGLRQNVIFLYKSIAASSNCEKVYFIHNHPTTFEEFPADLGLGKPEFVHSSKIPEDLDFLIMIGTELTIPTLKMLRERGCKVIFYKGGNAAIISIEATISKTPDVDSEKYHNYDCCDAVWMTPQHLHTYKGWAETIYRCPVETVPHIWDDSFFKLQKQDVLDNFGYKPGEKQWRISIFDPNITIMKTSHMPIMVSEYAYRAAPNLLKNIYITNTYQFREDEHFKSFVTSLSACKAGLMTAEHRFVTWDFLTSNTDAVVTHQWENGLNYIYYEVLYGNYPLIHNSEFIKECGYYYKEFEPEDGGRVMVEALKNHDKNLEKYKANNEKLFAKVNPTSPENVQIHEDLLLNTKRSTSFDKKSA